MLNRTIQGARAPIPPLDIRLPRSPLRKPASLQLARSGTLLFPHDTRQTARIVDGCICLFQSLADGRRQILDILGPGRLVGPYLADLGQCGLAALTLTQLEGIDAKADNARIAAATRQMLLRSQAHSLLLGRKTMAERVAFALLDLASQFPGSPSARGGATFMLHLTRGELADWLGLTLTSVSRCFNAFKRSGLIAFDHPKIITIRNKAALEALASGAPA